MLFAVMNDTFLMIKERRGRHFMTDCAKLRACIKRCFQRCCDDRRCWCHVCKCCRKCKRNCRKRCQKLVRREDHEETTVHKELNNLRGVLRR